MGLAKINVGECCGADDKCAIADYHVRPARRNARWRGLATRHPIEPERSRLRSRAPRSRLVVSWRSCWRLHAVGATDLARSHPATQESIGPSYPTASVNVLLDDGLY